MKTAKEIVKRIVATFFASAIPIIGGSAILDSVTGFNTSILWSALLTGCAASLDVIQRLAKSAIDGKLTFKEIDEAFSEGETR